MLEKSSGESKKNSRKCPSISLFAYDSNFRSKSLFEAGFFQLRPEGGGVSGIMGGGAAVGEMGKWC